MCQSSMTRRAFSSLIPAVSAMLLLGVFLVLPTTAVAWAPALTPLQVAVEEAQQELMDLKETMQTDATATRKTAVAELVRIGKKLKAEYDKSQANDPGRNVAYQSMAAIYSVLVEVTRKREPQPQLTRRQTANVICRAIEKIDELLGKW